MRIRLDFLPSRFDRSPASLRDAVEDSAEHSDLMALTEVTSRMRAAQLRGLPGWGAARNAHGGLAEVAIMWRHSAWDCLEYTANQIGPDLGPGGPVVAGLAVLESEDADREVLVLSVAHLPASVESTWRSSSRAAEHRRAVQEWRLLVLAFRRKYPGARVVVVADWNLSLFNPWVRLWIRSAWPGLYLRYALPKRGTHAGGRLIDWLLTFGLRRVRVTVLAPHPHSDHNRLRLRARSRRVKGLSTTLR